MEEKSVERINELNDLRMLLSKKYGRRFLWRLLEIAGVFRTTFSAEPTVAAFNEGHRNMGVILLADIMEASPADYLKMAEEAKEIRDEREQQHLSDPD